MTTPQTQAPSLLEQVLDLQDLMVRRGDLYEAAHEVLDGHFCADGQVLIECKCGRGMFSDYDRSERDYALHIARELGLKLVHR